MDWAHVLLGDLDQAIHWPRVVELHEMLGEPHQAAAALGNLGAMHYWHGRWDEALACYRRAFAAYATTGDVVDAAIQQSNIAEVLINRGQYQDARKEIVAADQTHRAVGHVDGALFDEVQLGRLLLGEGDAAGAADVLASVLEESRALSLMGTALHAAVHLAECRVAHGLAREALAILTEAEEGAGAEGAIFAAWVHLVSATACRQLGDTVAARQHIAEGVVVARRMDLAYELGLLLVLADDPAERDEGRRLLESLGVPITSG
jgi:tetratricopeptide (TPR) repeat protein